MARDAGSRWDRFDFIWPNIEPANGSWYWDPYDTLVDDLHAADVNMVGILLWTPDWAATSGLGALAERDFGQRPPEWYAPTAPSGVWAASTASSPPSGLYEEWNDWSWDDGDPVNHWGRFVYTTVSRYGDRVQHWEMWNEPEWDYFWTGTSTDYAQLLKVGYQATKAACPDCTVLFGGLHYWANPSYYRWVLNTLSQDPEAPQNNYFFDVMSVHLYSRSANAYDIVNEIRAGMTTFVPDHPIWLTETGVPVWDDESVDPDPTKTDYAATQQEAAAYVIQSYANAWASGVERYFFFRAHDADMAEYFGLIRNDTNRSLRPAYVAYQVAASYMVSPTMATSHTYPNGTRRVTLWGTPRGKLSVLWNTSPDELDFSYPAILPTAQLVDRWGVTQTITATDGGYNLALPGATANLARNPDDYIIGGEPYLLIEADTNPPTATLDPLPTTTYSDTIPVSWQGSDAETDIWGFDIQVQQDDGPWTNWMGLVDTIGITAAQYTGGEHDTTYCFRIRGWDQAGNRSAWSTDAQACTTINLEREVHVVVDEAFGDSDSDGVWDTDEVTLTQLSLYLTDGDGASIASVEDSSELTTTLAPGQYTLNVIAGDWPSPPPGWLPRRTEITVEPGESTQEIPLGPLGLLPHRASVFLPLSLLNH